MNVTKYPLLDAERSLKGQSYFGVIQGHSLGKYRTLSLSWERAKEIQPEIEGSRKTA